MRRDELNILADKYYEVMDIPEEKKEKRKKDAWELFDLFMLFFFWFEEAEKNNVAETTLFLPKFQNELQNVVSSITDIDDYLISYLATIALGIYSATVAHQGEKYYLSEDRAANLALNESNTINNYLDTKEAKDEGYTHKKWVAQLDERTRLEHIMMDGTVVPIDGYFEFSDCRMFGPHDVVNGTANQVANCRCSLKYLNNVVNYNLQFFADKSEHAQERENERHITDEDIKDALDNPLDDPYNYFRDDDKGGSIRYIGEKVTVVVNPETGIHITYFKTPKSLVRRLKNGF